MNFRYHASRHKGAHQLGGPPSWVFVFHTPKDWTHGRGNAGAWRGTWAMSACDHLGTAYLIPAKDIDFPKSLYNFPCGTLLEVEGNIREVVGSLDRRRMRTRFTQTRRPIWWTIHHTIFHGLGGKVYCRIGSCCGTKKIPDTENCILTILQEGIIWCCTWKDNGR